MKTEDSTPRLCVVRFGWQPFIMSPVYHLVDALHAEGVATTIVKGRARLQPGQQEEPHPRADMRYMGLALRRLTHLPVVGPVFQLLAWLEFVARAAWRAWRVPAGCYCAVDVDTLPAAWLAARLRGKPLIFYSYELYADRDWVPLKWFWRGVERWFIHRADLVVACEPNRAERLQTQFGLRERPLVVHNVSPRLETVPARGRIQEILAARGIQATCVFYYHGWIQRARCADAFIEALAGVPEGAVLFFVGQCEPALQAALEARVAALGLGQRVIFHGTVHTDDLLPLAASADVGLQAQRNIGLNAYYCAPIKLFQYFAVGLPVIASDFPGMRTIVAEHEAGLCVDPESVAAIRTAMCTLAADPALRARLGANARRTALERFHYAHEARPLLNFILARLDRPVLAEAERVT